MEWVLGFRHDALTPIFQGLTFLGDLNFFLVFLPLGYWLFDRQSFFRLTVLLCVTGFLNSALKEFFAVARPDEIPHLVHATGWSFPSGHAQVGAVTWGWLAWQARRRWATLAAALLIVGIATSRVYLGVHRPVDIFAGATLGLVTVAFAQWWTSQTPEVWQTAMAKIGQGGQFLLLTVTVAAMVLALPDVKENVVAMGVLFGVSIAATLEERWVGWSCPTGWGQNLAIAVIGLGVAGLLRWGLKVFLATMGFGATGLGATAADFLRYALIGVWIGLVGPWLFSRLFSRG